MHRLATTTSLLIIVSLLASFATPAPLPAGAAPVLAPQHIATPQATSYVQIAAGGEHTCGLTNSGLVYCWGRNRSGYLGDGTTTTRGIPAVVSGLSGVVAISAGDVHTCALLSDGTARCWGGNLSGQLGDGTTNDRLTPVAVSGLSGVVAITSGYGHTCALLSDGTARCWGSNGFGQLGDGTAGYSPVPVTVRPIWSIYLPLTVR